MRAAVGHSWAGIDSHRCVDEGVTVGNCRMNCLRFAGELVLNAWVFSTGLWHAFDRFSVVCDQAGTKNSTKRIELLRLSRQWIPHVSENPLQQVETFKDLEVVLTSDWSRNKEIDTRIGKANAVLRELYCPVVMKRDLSKTAKLSIFESIFVPILNCGHES